MNGLLFLSAVLGFLGGIVCRSFFYIGLPGIAFILTLGAIAGIFFLLFSRQVYIVLIVFLVSVPLGMLRTALVPMSPPESVRQILHTEVEVIGKVIADPDIRESSQRILIQQHDGSRILAVAPRFPEVTHGETITVAGMLVPPEPFATDGGRVFRYDLFLAKDRVFALLEDASVSQRTPRTSVTDRVRGALSDLKRALIGAIGVSLPEPHASLASGMLLGGKQGLGEGLVDVFTTTGLVHIVVLSGYNIMIIAEAAMRALGVLPRRIAISVAGAVIAGFVLMAGAGAAAFRAGVMALIALMARATGRTYDVLRALGFAIVIMLLWNPLLLLFDPGFQLSVIATLGLILGAPIVSRYLEFVRSKFLREILAATIAAQLFVLPLLLYQTGGLSLVSLPANLLVLPIVPLAMLLSFIAGIVALIVTPFATVIGLPAYFVLGYVVAVAQFLASISVAQLIIPAFPFSLVIAMYAALGWGVYLLHARRLPQACASRGHSSSHS